MIEPLAILSYLMAKPFGSTHTPTAMHVRVQQTKNHAPLPKAFTCNSKHPTPPVLSWSNVPTSAQSLAVVMIDLDTARPKSYNWAMYNLPTTATRLAITDKQAGLAWAENSRGETNYHAPCPHNRKHHYRIELYALDTSLPQIQGLTALNLRKAMQTHIVALASTDHYVARIKKKTEMAGSTHPAGKSKGWRRLAALMHLIG